uniref:Uncharacterized protein n=1 Tax=Octopus bimaculoides TaxID=37653 RepID=A0A0L8H5T6_OCTBM
MEHLRFLLYREHYSMITYNATKRHYTLQKRITYVHSRVFPFVTKFSRLYFLIEFPKKLFAPYPYQPLPPLILPPALLLPLLLLLMPTTSLTSMGVSCRSPVETQYTAVHSRFYTAIYNYPQLYIHLHSYSHTHASSRNCIHILRVYTHLNTDAHVLRSYTQPCTSTQNCTHIFTAMKMYTQLRPQVHTAMHSYTHSTHVYKAIHIYTLCAYIYIFTPLYRVTHSYTELHTVIHIHMQP